MKAKGYVVIEMDAPQFVITEISKREIEMKREIGDLVEKLRTKLPMGTVVHRVWFDYNSNT